jgi:hypothetical protein
MEHLSAKFNRGTTQPASALTPVAAGDAGIQ